MVSLLTETKVFLICVMSFHFQWRLWCLVSCAARHSLNWAQCVCVCSLHSHAGRHAEKHLLPRVCVTHSWTADKPCTVIHRISFGVFTKPGVENVHMKRNACLLFCYYIYIFKENHDRHFLSTLWLFTTLWKYFPSDCPSSLRPYPCQNWVLSR